MEENNNNISLFSLELVVEKLYLPHITCRFPAIAFRILDFPTIVINHVEDDLSMAIHQKMSLESPHQLPQQFHELKDRHGNFLFKKGKSCLFKMSPDVLKQHLMSTPLYVMAIDIFPKVSKLLGNAAVPLDFLINRILVDIGKLGPTVPSVHGDKGLFKLCNLMGVEIGYLVLGYRLLCLGPGLIPHLPPESVAPMALRNQAVIMEQKEVEELMEAKKVSQFDRPAGSHITESFKEVRDSFSMTEPMKADVFLQTMNLEDKVVNVNNLEKLNEEKEKPLQSVIKKCMSAVSTQTDKKKLLKENQNKTRKWVERNDIKVEDDGIIVNNIICPPPLFYNSEAEPAVYIEERTSNDFEDMSTEDLSEMHSYDGYGLDSILDDNERKKSVPTYPSKSREEEYKLKRLPHARPGEKVVGIPVVPQKETIFPLLSALINELSCIENPEFLLKISNRLQNDDPRNSKFSKSQIEMHQPESEMNIVSASVLEAVASALNKKSDSSHIVAKENKIEVQGIKKQQQIVKKPTPRENLTPKERADNAKKKKSKLVYGLTNTQRLRLQKVNPMWLKNLEKESAVSKSKASTSRKSNYEVDELDATNFSDTLTEVRRLAEKELDSTIGGDTLRNIASEVEEFEQTVLDEYEKKVLTETYNKKLFHSPRKTLLIQPSISQRSPAASTMSDRLAAGNKKQRSSLRSSLKPSLKHSNQRSSTQRSSNSETGVCLKPTRRAERHYKLTESNELRPKKRPVPLERHTFGLTSPPVNQQDHRSNDYFEENASVRSDVPSSRSRSIEVHLPSADQADQDDNATLSSDGSDAIDYDNDEGRLDVENDDIPLPDDSVEGKPKVMELNFPRYVSREMSLPDSIEGDPNGSLQNLSGLPTNDSPLESTRQSKLMFGDHCQDDAYQHENESRVLQSTDYDTRQFHSTDEPELQGLISDEENQSQCSQSGAHTNNSYSAAQSHSYTSVRASQKFPVINPQQSESSPVPSVRRSTTKLDPGALSYLPSMSLTKGQLSPSSSRPGSPKTGIMAATPSSYSYKNTKKERDSELEPIHKNAHSGKPINLVTPRSGQSSPKRQTPRARRQIFDYKTSIHTDSVSSYMPSDSENVLVSLSSNSGNYSDDFQPLASGESGDGNSSSADQLPKIIPNRKLGYTIT